MMEVNYPRSLFWFDAAIYANPSVLIYSSQPSNPENSLLRAASQMVAI
jgi:hypothetical protein